MVFDTIRIELQNILKNVGQTDEDLLHEISLVVAKESEHVRKVKGKSASVNNVGNFGGLSNDSSVNESKKTSLKSNENKILEELSKLTVKVNELSAVRGEVLELKRQMSNNAPGNNVPVGGSNDNQGFAHNQGFARGQFNGNYRQNRRSAYV